MNSMSPERGIVHNKIDIVNIYSFNEEQKASIIPFNYATKPNPSKYTNKQNTHNSYLQSNSGHYNKKNIYGINNTNKTIFSGTSPAATVTDY